MTSSKKLRVDHLGKEPSRTLDHSLWSWKVGMSNYIRKLSLKRNDELITLVWNLVECTNITFGHEK